MPLPNDQRQHLEANGQGHLAEHAESLAPEQCEAFTRQLRAVDPALVAKLFAGREAAQPLPDRDRIAPPPVLDADRIPEAESDSARGAVSRRVGGVARRRRSGHAAGLRRAEGLLPRRPPSRRDAVRRPRPQGLGPAAALRPAGVIPGHDLRRDRLGTPTISPRTIIFGLPAGEIKFFRQGTMPAVDLATGRILIEQPGRLALSPRRPRRHPQGARRRRIVRTTGVSRRPTPVLFPGR